MCIALLEDLLHFRLQARWPDVSVRALERCIADIRSWMIDDRNLMMTKLRCYK